MPFRRRREKPLLLMVDDDPMQRFLYREVLEQAGFDIAEASDGGTAISLFTESNPDLVLLDVMMPDMDGFATCRAIRALPGGELTPILIATGLDDVASIEASYEAGATDFISKPVNWALLPHRVRYAVRSDDVLRRLMLSERWLAEAQRIAAVGNFRWSPPGFAVQWSGEAARIFGYAAGDGRVALRAVLRRIAPADRPRMIRAFRRIDREQPIEIDCRVVLPDGETRYIAARAEIGFDQGAPACIQGTCHDITERKRTELELRQARDEARSADAAKTAFLATMSHELQTPLNGIIGFAELLAREAWGPISNDRYLEFAKCILNAGRRMYASVDDVVTMARLESGAYEPRCELLDLAALVNSAVAAFRELPEAAGRSISLVTGAEPAVALADERAVRRMLHNLMSNAVKFSTPDTPVTVRIDHTALGFRLGVEDRGIGMSAAEAAQALRPFRQLDQRLAREFEGMGLGLSITKQLIEANGGSIEIVSAPDAGTSVTLTFPAVTQQPLRPPVLDLSAAA